MAQVRLAGEPVGGDFQRKWVGSGPVSSPLGKVIVEKKSPAGGGGTLAIGSPQVGVKLLKMYGSSGAGGAALGGPGSG